MKIFELVVPAYNEEKNLEILVNRAKSAAQANGFSHEQFGLVLVNNGSLDQTAAKLIEFEKNPELGPWIRVVNVTQNQGYGFGLLQGLQSVKAQFAAWSHADLQCDPNDAFKALSILQEHKSNKVILKGIRNGRDWKDKIVSRFFEFLCLLILGLRVYEMNAQPKVFDSSFIKLLDNPPTTFAFDLYALYVAQKQGYEIKTIEVLFPPRIHGVSNWASNFLSRYKTILGIVLYIIKLAKKEGRI